MIAGRAKRLDKVCYERRLRGKAVLGRPVLGSLRRWTAKEQLTGLETGTSKVEARWKQSMQALFPIKSVADT